MNSRTARYLLVALCFLIFTQCKNSTKNNAGIINDPVYQSDPELKKITAQIGQSPDNAELFYRRGQLLHRLKMDTLAIRDYKMASSLDTGKAAYYSAIGDILFENRDLAGSVLWIQKAIAKDPEDQKARLKIAKMFLYIGKYQNAFEEINIVLRKNTYEPEAYFLKGMVYKELKDTAKAMSSFYSALNSSPDYRDAIIQLGLLYSNQKDTKALKFLDNAYTLDSTDVFPVFAKGVFYQQNGDYQTAKEEYRFCILRNPRYVDAYFNMGLILLDQDSTEKAFRQYDIATKIDYLNPTAFYDRGVCNEARDSTKLAIADYRKALDLDSTYKSPKDALKRLGVKK